MAFQRSYSKVWWGSDSNSSASLMSSSSLNFYQGIGKINADINSNGGFYSLDSHMKYSGNLSRIQEVEENSKLWRSHESPGSLRSQDSGFSDHDDSPQSQSQKSECDSPQSTKTIETPPTVIRRKGNLSSPLYSARRISFSAPTSPTFGHEKYFNNTAISINTSTDLINQIDKLSLVNGNSSTPKSSKPNQSWNESIVALSESCKCASLKDRSIRRRRVNRKTSKHIKEQTNFKDYNNETVYLGVDDNDDKYDNDCNNFDSPSEKLDQSSSEKLDQSSYICSSTPKNEVNNNHVDSDSDDGDDNDNVISYPITLPYHFEYDNPDLNENPLSCQYWLDDIRNSYDHEVMSTLQTKSIAREAFRNLKITTNAVAKIIRQLQTRSLILQNDFDNCEKLLKNSKTKLPLNEALQITLELIESVNDFIKILEKRSVFFTEHRIDRKKFEDNIEHIQLITKDLKYSLNNQQYLEIDSINEDIEVLKRYILITIRLVFEKLVRIIIVNIENSKCDLMLRANLNMISTLSNIDYTGFASLSNAFIENDTERVLLIICIENKLQSVRALALRALATICTTIESIQKFCIAGGIEIIRDILCSDFDNHNHNHNHNHNQHQHNHNEPEKREAVSLLTQITAPWNGADHKVDGIKDSIEGIVEGITDIIMKTNCCQTLLLCAASLNNLSCLEMTSVYSIMSNETIFKLKETVENRGPGVSIFLFEQIASMLYNMSSNKKCHSHLANKNIINFITYIFQSQFYEKFQTRSECEAHRKTIKTILHIFKRLIHESLVGQEILENNFIPIFSKVEQDLLKNNLQDSNIMMNNVCNDIIYLNKQLNESLTNKSFNRSSSSDGRNSINKLNLARQESYV